MSVAATTRDQTTVIDLLSFYLPRLQQRSSQHAPGWPADLFGLMSALLERSGAYLAALNRWPPANYREYYDNDNLILNSRAEDYRRSWQARGAASIEVADLFTRFIASCQGMQIWQFQENIEAAQQALMLLVISDQAFAPFSRGKLVEGGREVIDFLVNIDLLLARDGPATLGKEITCDRLVILPKRRTPQSGLNIRSLSLFICASRTSEVRSFWNDDGSANIPATRSEVNVLFLPWPMTINAPAFEPTESPQGAMKNMDGENFGWFTYRPPTEPKLLSLVENHLISALKLCRNVDLLVLPEAALNESQWRSLVDSCERKFPQLKILAGVAKSAAAKKSAGSNSARYFRSDFEDQIQYKHHRWFLTRSQIVQYHLGAALNPRKGWCDCIDLPRRHLNFFRFNSWLLFAPLICEDLARPDPAGDLLRAVGPDLVVALLMDGPQISSRWAARHAMTLADDPGCAVLSVTSAGLVDRSNVGRSDGRRIVALYKDPETGLREIELPRDSSGILLTLSQQPRIEYSADGRCEKISDTHPTLSGIQYIGSKDLTSARPRKRILR